MIQPFWKRVKSLLKGHEPAGDAGAKALRPLIGVQMETEFRAGDVSVDQASAWMIPYLEVIQLDLDAHSPNTG